MFKKNEITPPTENEVETLIGPSVKVEGDFIGAGNIVVAGTVTGKLKTKKDLRVEQNARILANISAENALIAGEVQGNLKIKHKLELTSTAKIIGDIETQVLVIAEGAMFTGNCKMVTSEGKAVAEPAVPTIVETKPNNKKGKGGKK